MTVVLIAGSNHEACKNEQFVHLKKKTQQTRTHLAVKRETTHTVSRRISDGHPAC
jgi:hypothetical protein